MMTFDEYVKAYETDLEDLEILDILQEIRGKLNFIEKMIKDRQGLVFHDETGESYKGSGW